MNKDLNIDLDEISNDVKKLQEENIDSKLFINLYKNTFLSPIETLENSKFSKIR